MAITAQNVAELFFSRTDVNKRFGIDSAEHLWCWLIGGASVPLSGHQAPLPTGDKVVYRGQARADYGLTSSLYRLCRTARPAGVKELDIAGVEAALIDAMRDQGLGRRMSDGLLLTVLQHHGVPTRLIDFSRTPLEALYFAVENHDTVDGRLFIVNAHGHPDGMAVNLGTPGDGTSELPWAGLARGTEYASGPWTQTVALVNSGDLDPRMVAQNGVFLVGGLNRRYAGRLIRATNPGATRAEEISLELYADVTTLGINFPTRATNGNASWPATGWTVRIDAAWKPLLRERLKAESDSIWRDSMYPPLDEVWRLAAYAALQELGPQR